MFLFFFSSLIVCARIEPTTHLTTDLESTKRLLVQCANNLVPMSLILVGVGKGDMRDMSILDADRQTLSSRGVKARRDIVQFVGESRILQILTQPVFFFLSLRLDMEETQKMIINASRTPTRSGGLAQTVALIRV